MRSFEQFSVEIESLDQEGRGVGHRDGKVAFVEGALPGERVTYERRRSKPSYETGRAVAIERASVLRVTPPCPHFGIGPGFCGGCSMQHLAPRAQVAVKQRVLEDSLWHIGQLRPGQILRPLAGASWHYRHRARLTVRHVAKKGGVLVGFHERASSYVADMDSCLVLPERVGALLRPLRELIATLSVRDRLPQIEVAVTQESASEQIVLVLRVLEDPSADDRERLAAFSRQHAVEFWLQRAGPATAAPLLPGQAAHLALRLPEFDVELPFGPTDFTQVNHRVNEILVARALRLLDVTADEQAADFFCGLGNFTLPLARRARRVIGLEGSAVLTRRAAAAARANGLDGRAGFETRDLFEWTVEEWPRLLASHGPIAKVLIDPPREGALALVRSLAAAAEPPKRMVYVSCNPATLARDCAVLVHEGGWSLQAAGIVNMFPHTSHVESIAVLEPGRGPRPGPRA